MKKIKIVVDEDGNIKRDFIGFEGDECFKEAKIIDKDMEDAGIMILSKKVKKKDEKVMAKERVKG